MNNPLKYTDPSGYNPFKAIAKAWRSTWRSIKKYGRQVVAIVVAIQCISAGCSLHNCIYYNSEYCKGLGCMDQH
jgi:hypothetical protein